MKPLLLFISGILVGLQVTEYKSVTQHILIFLIGVILLISLILKEYDTKRKS